VSIDLLVEGFFIDKPDPFTTFTVGTQSYTTNVLKDVTTKPTWPQSFDIVWDGISDLKINLQDSNWFFPDGLLGSLQLNLNSGFPVHKFVDVVQKFDDYPSTLSFSLRLNPLPLAEKIDLLEGQTVRDGKVVDKFTGLVISTNR
jgi:hypothetical protein